MIIFYRLNFVDEHYNIVEQAFYMFRDEALRYALRRVDARARARNPSRWSSIICHEVRLSSTFEETFVAAL